MKIQPTYKLPPGSYFGGKGAAGVVHHIINQIPKHHVFVSGCLGRCAVTQWKLPATFTFGVDIDATVIEMWRQATGPDIRLIRGSVFDLFKYLVSAPTFLYLDPPYLHSTRTMTNQYAHEMIDADHIALLSAARSLPCMVAISTYDNDLYRNMLHDWRKINFRSQTRGGPRLETLYMNYPEPSPDQLHDTRFLGPDFRAREKSKRRVNTILRKIEKLTPAEKAILQQQISST